MRLYLTHEYLTLKDVTFYSVLVLLTCGKLIYREKRYIIGNERHADKCSFLNRFPGLSRKAVILSESNGGNSRFYYLTKKICVFLEPFPHHSEMKDAEDYVFTEMVII